MKAHIVKMIIDLKVDVETMTIGLRNLENTTTDLTTTTEDEILPPVHPHDVLHHPSNANQAPITLMIPEQQH